ncbi:MAG TPA: phytanoyl-CoA dioxygenase family protein [Fimbriimonadaceae bacterium]|nr:phytanoyl-CoA dioxygenase family protein [Fimbriimonadaceae bacterium]
MTVSEALQSLGARSDLLTAGEVEQLDRDGFLPISGVLAAPQREAIAARLEELLEEEGDRAGLEAHQELGTARLSDLVNKGVVFDIFYTHPKVLAAIAHVLDGDLKLSSLNARFALPGKGLQNLHADWGRLEQPGEFQVCNSIWLLDDFTEDNGATRVVPGSQLWETKLPEDEMSDTSALHPREKLLLAPAGTVVVFNSHTWHGGTLNRTDRPRRAVHSYFVRRHHPQQVDQRRYIRPETRERLSEAAKVILGVE